MLDRFAFSGVLVFTVALWCVVPSWLGTSMLTPVNLGTSAAILAGMGAVHLLRTTRGYERVLITVIMVSVIEVGLVLASAHFNMAVTFVWLVAFPALALYEFRRGGYELLFLTLVCLDGIGHGLYVWHDRWWRNHYTRQNNRRIARDRRQAQLNYVRREEAQQPVRPPSWQHDTQPNVGLRILEKP